MLELPWQCIPAGAVFAKALTTTSGGRTLGGQEQVVETQTGYWQAQVDLHVVEEEQSLAWRGFYASVNGRSTPFLVPAYNLWRPRDLNGAMLGMHSVSGYGGGRAHHQHAGFEVEDRAQARTIGNATARESRITVEHTGTEGLRPGHYFGIGERLYLVARAWSVEHSGPVQAGGVLSFGGETLTFGGEAMTFGTDEIRLGGRDVQIIDFWPPLRAAAPHDTPLRLTSPVCRMRFASDDMGALDQGAIAYGLVSLTLVEDI